MPSRQGEDNVIGVDSIIIMLIVGAIAGWLAGQIVRGFGFGLLWNIVIGIVGAFIGVWLLRQLGFMPFAGFIGSIVNAHHRRGHSPGHRRIHPALARLLLRPSSDRTSDFRRRSHLRARTPSARPQPRLAADRR